MCALRNLYTRLSLQVGEIKWNLANKIHFIIFDLRISRIGIGPKIRVPKGVPVACSALSRITHAFSPKLTFIPFDRTYVFFTRTTTATLTSFFEPVYEAVLF